jgi:hypothetical protein
MKKLIIAVCILSLFLIGIVIAGSTKQVQSPMKIVTGSSSWNIVSSNPFDNSNYFVWYENKTKQKTEVCFVSYNATKTQDLKDLDFYYNSKKDGKNKTASLLKSEKLLSSKTGLGKDYYGYCYTITSDEKYLKFGKNSTVILYDNETKVEYSSRYNNLNITLQKWNGQNFITSPSDIFINTNNANKLKFGAIDTNPYNSSLNSLNTYKYTFTSSQGFSYDTFKKEYYFLENFNKRILDFSDICNKVSNCSFSLTSPKILEVTFKARNINGIVTIDPYLSVSNTLLISDRQLITYNRTEFNPQIKSVLNTLNLTLKDAISTTGKIGNAYLFDGNQDYIYNSGSHPEFEQPQITISAWIYPTASDTYDTIVQYGKGLGQSYGLNINLLGSSPNTAGFYFYNGAWRKCEDNQTITLNTWSFLSATYNGTQARYYRNGQLINTCNIGSAFDYTTIHGFRIGTYGSLDSNYFNGIIDEVVVFNRTLNGSEIQTMYNSGNGLAINTTVAPYNSGLIAGYNLDDILGVRLLNDSSTTFFTNGESRSLVFQDTYNVTGATYTIDDPTGADGTINYGSGGYFTYSITHAIHVYSYKLVNGVRIYSNSYSESTKQDDGVSGSYYISWSWNAVAGADGYRILKYDDYNYYNFDVYYDTSSTSFNDGDGSMSWTAGSTVTPTSYTEVFYTQNNSHFNLNLSSSIPTNTKLNVSVRTANDYIIPANLAGMWNFNQGDARDIRSISNGSLYSVTSSEGVVGTGMLFDGIDDYISLEDSDILKPTEITVSAWIKRSFSPTNYETVLVKSTDANWGDGYGLTYNDNNKLSFWINNYGLHYVETDINTDWNHVVGTYNGSAITLYLNGVEIDSSDYNESISHTSEKLFIGKGSPATSDYFWTGQLDEIAIFNKSLSASEVSDLYDNFNINFTSWGASTDITQENNFLKYGQINSSFYQFRNFFSTSDNTKSATIKSFDIFGGDFFPPSVVFNYQIPADLNLTNFIGPTGLNITYNISDASGLNINSIKLFFKSNSTQDNVMYYQNGTAYSGYFSSSANFNISDMFSWNLLDNAVLTGTYNYGEVSMENTPHSSNAYANSNTYVAVELLNVSSTTQYGFLDFMFNRSAGNGGLRIYYCNSSYNFNSIVTSSPHCYNFFTLTNNTYNHGHTNYSKHMVVPFTNSTGNVTITPTSYFLFRGISGSTWNYFYINNVSRASATKATNNNGITWGNMPITIDAHLHQFGSNYSFFYYVCANDTLNNQNCSPVRQDLFELGGLPPTSPTIITPQEGYYSGNINISYSASVSPNSYAISYYNISLFNTDFTFNKTILNNNSVSLNYTWDTSTTTEATYVIRVEATDTLGQKSQAFSDNFTIDRTAPNVNITYPKNVSYNTNISSLNYTFVETNPSSCWYSINGGITNTSVTCGTNLTNLNSVEGSNKWMVAMNDSANNKNASYITFFKDSISPTITLISPEDRSMDTDGVVRFTFIPFDANNIVNCSLNSQDGTYTTSNSIVNNATNVIEVVGINGNHQLYKDELRWNILCIDNLNNAGYSSTFYLDTKEDYSSMGLGAGAGGTTLNPQYINIFYPETWYRGENTEVKIEVFNKNNEKYKPLKIGYNDSNKNIELVSSEFINGNVVLNFNVNNKETLGKKDIELWVEDEKAIERKISFDLKEKEEKSNYAPEFSEIKKILIWIVIGIVLLGLFLTLAIAISKDKKKPN